MEVIRLKTPCLGCGEPVRAPRCRVCQQKLDYRRNTSEARAPYRDPEYRRNRLELLAEQPSCWRCTAPATTADHIVPISRGGSNARTNLRPACLAHNSGRRS